MNTVECAQNSHPTAQLSTKRLGRVRGLGKRARRLFKSKLTSQLGGDYISSVLQLVHVDTRA